MYPRKGGGGNFPGVSIFQRVRKKKKSRLSSVREKTVFVFFWGRENRNFYKIIKSFYKKDYGLYSNFLEIKNKELG